MTNVHYDPQGRITRQEQVSRPHSPITTTPRNGTENRGRLARLSHSMARIVPVRAFRWRSEQPVVSFTFDDFPVSAAQNGAAILEQADARGTFYAASSMLGASAAYWDLANADDVLRLAAKGHEIGLHTHTHTPLWALSGDGISREVALNEQALQAIAHTARLRNFAYPYGLTTMAAKWHIGAHMRSSRSVERGLNHGVVDLDYLRCVELADARLSPCELQRWLEKARDSRSWLIFATHDVSPAPSPYGTSLDLLREAVSKAVEMGFRVLTIDEALDRGGAPL